MNKIYEPDKCFEEIKKSGDKNKAIEFFRNEINAILELRSLLQECKTFEYFNKNIDKMIECSKSIRKTKINSIGKQFKFYNIVQKYFFCKFKSIIFN